MDAVTRFDATVAAAASSLDRGSNVVIDAASARDLGLFLTAGTPRAGNPIHRPVIVVRDGRRSVVRLHATVNNEGVWEFTLGEALPDIAAPDRAEIPDARLDEMATMVWLTDADRLARWFNTAWLEFVGAELADELGWGWMRHLHPDDLVGLLERYEAAAQHRAGFDHVARVADRHGNFHWLLVRAVPRSDGDDFAGFIGLCHSVASNGLDEPEPVIDGEHPSASVLGRLDSFDTAFAVTRPAEPLEVVVLRRLASRWAAHHPVLRHRHDDIVLAVGEAVANSVVHAYRADPGLVQLTCEMDGSRAHVRVRDWGHWIEPKPGHGGHGLTLMHALSDECEIRHLGDATEVVLSYRVS